MAKKPVVKKFYKIRHKKTGLFSHGGSYTSLAGEQGCGWSSKGKIWMGIGPVKNHLAQYLPKGKYGYEVERFQKNIGPIREDWEIVEIEMVVKEVIPMSDLYNDFDIIKRVSK